MSAAVPFSTLITQVQRRANIDNEPGPIALTEVRDYLNEGLTQFQDLLIEARGQEHCRKVQNFNTVANQSAYPLAADFYELISVDWQISTNQFIPVHSYMEFERNAFRFFGALTTTYPGWAQYYRIQGSSGDQNVASATEKTINFIPTPSAAYPIGINYIWRYPTFDTAGSQDSNVVNGVNGWEVYAIWWAVAACKHRLREDAGFAMARMQELEMRIRALAPSNDAGHAERIRDVEANDTYGWLGLFY